MKTPAANRWHIGIYGPANSGKSSLINALTGQETALVSPVPGTTTDPVKKAMEVHGLGPVVFIDTAGFDDVSELGALRVERTQKTTDSIDLALLLVEEESFDQAAQWFQKLKDRNIPTLALVNKVDLFDPAELLKKIRLQWATEALDISSKTHHHVEQLQERIRTMVTPDERFITRDLVKAGDVVLLVMPQDIQAPKGRLILPQVQTLRELLDRKCSVICTTTDRLQSSLEALKEAPELLITDSQVFDQVYPLVPKESRLTSFSVLFAAYKGDADYFMQSARAIATLNEHSKVLISEACTHAPKEEDIGTIKIPALLRKQVGGELQVDFVRGVDFPENLKAYDLIIHCGSCMFNRAHVLSRVRKAREQGVPMTNYGMALAQLNGILDHISL